jgi:hypothetical protein
VAMIAATSWVSYMSFSLLGSRQGEEGAGQPHPQRYDRCEKCMKIAGAMFIKTKHRKYPNYHWFFLLGLSRLEVNTLRK